MFSVILHTAARRLEASKAHDGRKIDILLLMAMNLRQLKYKLLASIVARYALLLLNLISKLVVTNSHQFTRLRLLSVVLPHRLLQCYLNCY